MKRLLMLLAIAGVRFAARLQKNNDTPDSVHEIWHMQKNLRGDEPVWLLADIRQTVLH